MLNMLFDKKVVIDTNQAEWKPGTVAGVWQKLLAFGANGHLHTTSLLRYDAESMYAPHDPSRGEEILVLDGVFVDESGEHPQGSYLRNPPGLKSLPISQQGCKLLVKLDQFADDDVESVRIDTSLGGWLEADGRVQMIPLHDFDNESVALLKWPEYTKIAPHRHFGGEEVFVLSGTLYDEYGSYPTGCWMRLPDSSEHCPYVDLETIAWVKTGHIY